MELTFTELYETTDIVVRAMDEAMNVQPRNLCSGDDGWLLVSCGHS